MNHEVLKAYALSFLNLPYIWGGDDPILGYDCSGLVQEILMGVGIDPKGDQTAQMLYNYFSENGHYNRREFGSLSFYGKSFQRITHVGFCLDKRLMIEAGGGGSRTNDSKDAARQNAYVRIRPIDRRSDLVACILPKYEDLK